MKIKIRGIGIWIRGARNWQEFCLLARNEAARDNADWCVPAPDAIPVRERRRAPLIVKLGVEVAYQACAMAGVDPDGVTTVFTSSMGDTNITDYMCRSLAGQNKVLSPTRFHNSVHNAPAGYWSISASNQSPSSSVAGSRESFPVAMLEACTQSTFDRRPILLVATDISVPLPLGEVYPIDEPCGLSLLIESADDEDCWTINVTSKSEPVTGPAVSHPLLREISAGNPAAGGMALLEALANSRGGELSWPLNDTSSLVMYREGNRQRDAAT